MSVPPLQQLTSAKYTAQLVDESGNAVPASSLVALTLTLTDKATGTVINGRNAQDVLNTNNVTLDSNGNLTWDLQPLDNGIVNTRLAVETHLAVFQATWATGRVNHRVNIPVQNLGLTA